MTTYLEHHGIKGQKWGIRRYQNKDGSLTAAGRERYGVGDGTARENYSNAKKAFRDANDQYNKSFKDAYRNNHPYSLNKQKRADTDARWEKAHDDAQTRQNAKDAMKKARSEYRNSDDFKDDRRKALQTAAKIGAAAAAAGLAVYGAKKYSDAVKSKAFQIQYDKGREYREHLLGELSKAGDRARAAETGLNAVRAQYDDLIARGETAKAEKFYYDQYLPEWKRYSRSSGEDYARAQKNYTDAQNRLRANAKSATSSFKDAYQIIRDDKKRKR